LFPHETHFIPFFYRQFARFGDVSERAAFNRFFNEFSRTTFCRRMDAKGIVFDEAEWFGRLSGNHFRDVLMALFACYRARSGTRIVGDKTPDYITQVPLLSRLFPDAKFIHIARDPRDYVLSMRRAWGKSTLRSTQRWKDQIRKYRADALSCGIRHMDIRYEELITSPEPTLSALCKFLGIEFNATMLSLSAPSENLGDTRGMTTVVSDNSGKWQSQLGRDEIEGIESIAGQLMQELGYTVVSRAGDENLSRFRMALYQLHDGANLFRFRIRDEGGILPALAQTYRATIHAGVDE
jgi:hypothetical protein